MYLHIKKCNSPMSTCSSISQNAVLYKSILLFEYMHKMQRYTKL